MNEKEFIEWYSKSPEDLFERFNEIRMPGELSLLSRKALRKFFKEGAWLVLVRKPHGRWLTIHAFDKQTGKWRNFK